MEQHALTTDKTPYELARDRRVAKIAKAFLPVEIACADLWATLFLPFFRVRVLPNES
jgi:hypothetical protein